MLYYQRFQVSPKIFFSTIFPMLLSNQPTVVWVKFNIVFEKQRKCKQRKKDVEYSFVSFAACSVVATGQRTIVGLLYREIWYILCVHPFCFPAQLCTPHYYTFRQTILYFVTGLFLHIGHQLCTAFPINSRKKSSSKSLLMTFNDITSMPRILVYTYSLHIWDLLCVCLIKDFCF